MILNKNRKIIIANIKNTGIPPSAFEALQNTMRDAAEMANKIQEQQIMHSTMSLMKFNLPNQHNSNTTITNPTQSTIDQTKIDFENGITNPTQSAIDQAKIDFENGITDPTQGAINQTKIDFKNGLNSQNSIYSGINQSNYDFKNGVGYENLTQSAINQAEKDLLG